MAITLWDVTDVACTQEFRPKTTVRAKHRYADLPLDDVLPFISIGMPVQLPKRAGFEVENNASDCCRNWKTGGVYAPFAAAFEHAVRRFGKHSKFVRLRRRNRRASQILRYLLRRNRAAGKINFLARKSVKD